MDPTPLQRARQERAWFTLAVYLVLMFPLVNLLRYHHYPFAALEILALALVLLLVSGVIGLVTQVWRRTARAIAAGLLLGGAFHLQAGLDALPTLALVMAGSVMGYLLQVQWSKILAASMATMLLVALWPQVEPPDELADHQSDLPRIVHLVLDGHASPAAIPPHQPPGWVNRRLEALYVGHGFQLYQSAYSHYTATVDSLYNMMNFQAEPTQLFRQFEDAGEPATVGQARYLDQLADAGYRFRVHRSTEVDLCAGIRPEHLVHCSTLPTPWLRSIRSDSTGLIRRIGFILGTLANQSPVLPRWLGRLGISTQTALAAASPSILSGLVGEVTGMGPGEVLLAHLLTPHGPFVYDAGCLPRYDVPAWERQSVTRMSGHPTNTPATRERRYGRYLEQMVCMATALDAFLGALDEAGVLANTVVIVHGDHGSRIAEREAAIGYREDLTAQDLLDNFGALYAARVPGQPGGLVSRPTPLEQALAGTLQTLLGEPIPMRPEPAFVFLTGAGQITPLAAPVFAIQNAP